ncbi:molybdopterin-synthase adenylyltransferase MoeB [Nesterenkonia massiliensis]|uniref:Molybdopterin-synthase adenylyltransferase MoeB n=1 Tax=Nesterenkonia massiliensis TaxID=1232429 RepID=A0ABT2HQ86_9MICC|nr:molybdopterin-synthase adenylyltransferase MoeB [Nesterenkonia massiliensis]MCT1606841.1 molybdopterin-synthase adenylyltransferase MoeB [Nesterenkonia massiliensis]
MTDLSAFSRSQAERFQRHFALAGFGIEAQAKLLRARVLVVGAGGLGAPILTYLAAAGVGTIEVIDHDVVDRSNLHRQVIHSEATVGQPKTASAAAVMRGLHPEVNVIEHRQPLTAQNALELVEPVDIVVDGSDNFATRYVVSDACEIAGVPLVSGSILRFAGQVSLFWSRLPSGERGPTYRDLYPEAPDAGEVPTCAEAGVLGVLPGVIGSLMATETIKHLAGVGETLLGRVLSYDALTASFREFRLEPDPQREPVTSIGADVTGLGGGPDVDAACEVPAHQADDDGAAADLSPTDSAAAETAAEDSVNEDSVNEDIDFNPFTGDPKQADDLTPREFRQAVARGEIAGVVDVREPWEHQQGTIEDAVNIPLMTLWRESPEVPGLDEAADDRPVVVYCAHGVRSRQALQLLSQRYPGAPVKNLLGGYELYRQQ